MCIVILAFRPNGILLVKMFIAVFCTQNNLRLQNLFIHIVQYLHVHATKAIQKTNDILIKPCFEIFFFKFCENIYKRIAWEKWLLLPLIIKIKKSQLSELWKNCACTCINLPPTSLNTNTSIADFESFFKTVD